MLSAPATIPATSEATFNPALAPLSPGTLRCSPANVDRPAESASASTVTPFVAATAAAMAAAQANLTTSWTRSKHFRKENRRSR